MLVKTHYKNELCYCFLNENLSSCTQLSIMSLPLKIIFCIVVCVGLGSFSGVVAGNVTGTWYQELTKPSFQPPSWVFAPAWTILYTLIGAGLGLIWHQHNKYENAGKALTLFGIQLVLNLFWTPVFFRMENPALALVIIAILWILIIWTIRSFMDHSKLAGYLLIPYLLWVTFATVLNACIVALN